MGGGNPLKSVVDTAQKAVKQTVGALAVDKITESDTIRALTGRETRAEKEAKGQQQASLLAAKAEADTALEERKKRMFKKDQGRASLLSGTELGVQASDLKSTLG